MKTPFLLAALVASTALAAIVSPWTETQALTASAPTTDATYGVSIVDVAAYKVTVCAPAGQTLTGGYARTYWYNPNNATKPWTHFTVRDMAINTAAGACQSWDEIESIPSGRIAVVADAITVSSGTTVSVRIDPVSK